MNLFVTFSHFSVSFSFSVLTIFILRPVVGAEAFEEFLFFQTFHTFVGFKYQSVGETFTVELSFYHSSSRSMFGREIKAIFSAPRAIYNWSLLTFK